MKKHLQFDPLSMFKATNFHGIMASRPPSHKRQRRGQGYATVTLITGRIASGKSRVGADLFNALTSYPFPRLKVGLMELDEPRCEAKHIRRHLRKLQANFDHLILVTEDLAGEKTELILNSVKHAGDVNFLHLG